MGERAVGRVHLVGRAVLSCPFISQVGSPFLRTFNIQALDSGDNRTCMCRWSTTFNRKYASCGNECCCDLMLCVS